MHRNQERTVLKPRPCQPIKRNPSSSALFPILVPSTTTLTPLCHPPFRSTTSSALHNHSARSTPSSWPLTLPDLALPTASPRRGLACVVAQLKVASGLKQPSDCLGLLPGEGHSCTSCMLQCAGTLDPSLFLICPRGRLQDPPPFPAVQAQTSTMSVRQGNGEKAMGVYATADSQEVGCVLWMSGWMQLSEVPSEGGGFVQGLTQGASLYTIASDLHSGTKMRARNNTTTVTETLIATQIKNIL